MADEQFEFAGFDDAVGVRIDDGVVCDGNVEGDDPAFARLQFDASKRLEFPIGPAGGCHEVPDICLHDLDAVTLPGVGHGDFGMYGVGCGEDAGRRDIANRRIIVLERGVSESLAERERRILRQIGVPVAMLASDLVVIDRQLTRMARESDRQTPGWVRQTENDLGYGATALHAR